MGGEDGRWGVGRGGKKIKEMSVGNKEPRNRWERTIKGGGEEKGQGGTDKKKKIDGTVPHRKRDEMRAHASWDSLRRTEGPC